MDQTQLQQNIALYYSKLPPSSQQVFSSMAWMEALKAISAKYNLTSSQIETLATETTLVLLGIIDLTEYESTLIRELALPKDTMDKMLAELDETLLKNIRPELEEAFMNNVQSLSEESEAAQSTMKLDPRFISLPEEVQQAIADSDYQKKLYDIATSSKLSIQQMGLLEEVTDKVLIGTISPTKFEEELQSKLGVDASKASELVTTINETVLKGIRESMRMKREGGARGAPGVDDEVPVPPYAHTEQAPRELPKVNVPETITSSPISNVMPILSQKTNVATPENPLTKTVSENKNPNNDILKNIIASKLSGNTVTKPIVSNQTIPNITPKVTTPLVAALPQAKPSDPYKEVIE